MSSSIVDLGTVAPGLGGHRGLPVVRPGGFAEHVDTVHIVVITVTRQDAGWRRNGFIIFYRQRRFSLFTEFLFYSLLLLLQSHRTRSTFGLHGGSDVCACGIVFSINQSLVLAYPLGGGSPQRAAALIFPLCQGHRLILNFFVQFLFVMR